MKSSQRQSIAWLYRGDHLRHPFIQLALKALVRVGYRVVVVDQSTTDACAVYEHVRTSRTWEGRVGFASLLCKLHAWLRALLRTVARRPSHIVATLPQDLAIGWMAAILLRSRLIYYPFEVYGEQHWPANRLLSKLELLLLRYAVDAVLTQNDARARIYAKERGARVQPVVVHNYKPCQSVESSGRLRHLLQLPNHWQIVLYEGELVRGRWLDRVVRAAEFLPQCTILVFMGHVTPWWREHVEPLLLSPAVAGKIALVPWVSQDELPSYVADADVGLIIYDDEVRNNYYCEPGKLSDYVMSGVPVVAPDFPTIGPVVRQHGVGEVFACADPHEIAAAITRVLSVPKATWRPMMESARRQLAWETQEPTLLQAIIGEDVSGGVG